MVATHVAHGVLRRVPRLAPREDARREVAVLVRVPIRRAAISVRAREEAVDDHEVRAVPAWRAISARLSSINHAPRDLAEQRVLGAQEEQLVAHVR